jgi:hypothetical protein
MVGACNTYGRDYKFIVLVGKADGKRPHARPRRRQQVIKMDIKVTVCGMD